MCRGQLTRLWFVAGCALAIARTAPLIHDTSPDAADVDEPTAVPPTAVPEPVAPAILVPELTGQFSTINGGQIDLGWLLEQVATAQDEDLLPWVETARSYG